MPFLSIIIPTFNRHDYLETTLRSILEQPFFDYEIIVVDDGGTDKTETLIRLLNDSRILYHWIENSERGAARNFGLRIATGEYVNYFDSDDLYLPCLHSLSTFIKVNSADVVYGIIQHVDVDGRRIPPEALPYDSFTKNLLHNNFLASGSVFLKRSIANLFPFHDDRRLSSAEDWELWLRIHTQYNFIKFPEPVFQQVHHDMRSIKVIDASKIEIRDSYFAELINDNEVLKNFYGTKAIRLFIADRFTFIALAWCNYNRKRAFFYWRKSLMASMSVVARKRFWAILKKLILG